MEADGAVDAQNAAHRALENAVRFPRAPTEAFPIKSPTKNPKGPKMALGNPDRPVFFPFLHDSDLSILRSESTLATCPNFGVHLYRREAAFEPPAHGAPVNTKEARDFLYGVAAVNLGESMIRVAFRHGSQPESRIAGFIVAPRAV